MRDIIRGFLIALAAFVVLIPIALLLVLYTGWLLSIMFGA